MTDPNQTQGQNELQVPSYIKVPAIILSRISPTLAAKFAARLFCTPFRFTMPEREREMDKHSKQERLIVPEIGKEITVYHYGKSSRKVLLVHGWSGRGTQLSAIAGRLIEEGYSTISFDAPAHGKAPGKKTEMLEFIASCQFLSRKYGPFEFGIGHSLGAMALMQSVAKGARFEKLILIGSGNLVWDIMQDFTKKLGLSPVIGILMKRYFDEISGMDTQDLSAEKVAGKINIPVLVIHDTEDRDVPVTAAYAIHKNLPKGSLHITTGLGHRKILGDKGVIDKILSFIKERPQV